MFFLSSNITAEIQTVLEMEWQHVDASAGFRPFHSLTFRLAGDATIFTKNSTPVHVLENEITFSPARLEFSKKAEYGKIIAVHFFSNSGLPNEVLRFSPKNANYFRAEFLRLHRVWTEKKHGYEYESKIILYKIMLEIEREWANNKTTSGRHRLSAALNHINEYHSEGAVSVEQLARICGMSDTYFRKLFVAEFGMTPQQYISQIRLMNARELLQSGYFSISEVADRCGFNNINYFSTFIKRKTGLSPKQLRDSLLEIPQTSSCPDDL